MIFVSKQAEPVAIDVQEVAAAEVRYATVFVTLRSGVKLHLCYGQPTEEWKIAREEQQRLIQAMQSLHAAASTNEGRHEQQQAHE